MFYILLPPFKTEDVKVAFFGGQRIESGKAWTHRDFEGC
jgi:hypothetical protein